MKKQILELRDPEIIEAIRSAVVEIKKPKPFKSTPLTARFFGSDQPPNRLAERREYGEESRAEREAREAAEAKGGDA